MTDADDEAGHVPTEAEKERIRQAVVAALVGAGLKVRELAHELVINNPYNPAKGQVYVDYEEGHVARRYVAWDYLGQLEGFEGDETKGTITREEIVRVLGRAQ